MAQDSQTTQTMGLILKEMRVGENDRLITLLTRDLGVIRAFASGSLKMSSKSLSATSFLTYSRLIVYKSKNRDTYRINDASPEKIFWELRNDFSLLSLASYFCEVCMTLAPKDEPADDFLRLVLNCLHLLSLKDKTLISPETIKSVFELRCCLYSGYMPDSTACCKCGGDLTGNCLFDLQGGVFYCNRCYENALGQPNSKARIAVLDRKRFITVPPAVLAAIRHILYSPLEKCFGFKINDKSLKILSDSSEKFLINQAGRNFETLNFYKTYKI